MVSGEEKEGWKEVKSRKWLWFDAFLEIKKFLILAKTAKWTWGLPHCTIT